MQLRKPHIYDVLELRGVRCCWAQEYVATSLMRVRQRKSTDQLAHNGEAGGGRDGDRRNSG